MVNIKIALIFEGLPEFSQKCCGENIASPRLPQPALNMSGCYADFYLSFTLADRAPCSGEAEIAERFPKAGFPHQE
jgi:hypothetical protein